MCKVPYQITCLYIFKTYCQEALLCIPQQMFHLAAFLVATLLLDACALPSDVHIHLHKGTMEGVGPTKMGKDYENGGKSHLKQAWML